MNIKIAKAYRPPAKAFSFLTGITIEVKVAETDRLCHITRQTKPSTGPRR